MYVRTYESMYVCACVRLFGLLDTACVALRCYCAIDDHEGPTYIFVAFPVAF